MKKTDFCLLFYSIFVNVNILLHLETGISANADHCTQSGSLTQYTFKSIQKRMSEDEVHNKLCQILNGDFTTVARLNKASATVSSWSLNN